MSNLQTYLRNLSQEITLEQAAKNIYVGIKRHINYPNLILFKYKDITVSFDNPCTRESRGIILDEANNWNIISYPYDKFFNFGEKNASVIDWNNARVYEKLDGCLMTLYYYDNKWLVSSSGKPDAAGLTSHGGSGATMGDAFWEIWNQRNLKLPTDTNLCYIFEMLSDKQPVKITYPENNIILHGARNIRTLEELTPDVIASMYGWPCIEEHVFSKDPNEIIKFVNSRSGITHEGLIVCDDKFNRIKIKSQEYVAITYSLSCLRLRPEDAKKKLFELITSRNMNDLSELCNSFSELASVCKEVETLINNVSSNIQNDYDKLKDINNQKEFALAAKQSKFTTCLFMLRNKRADNPLECLRKCGYEYMYQNI